MKTKIPCNVFLTGFMGTGKSTVGKLLADLLECSFVDLDEMIEQRQNRSIAVIFAADGERYFRDCETEILKELPQLPRTIYATGGGLVIRDENRRQMQSLGRIVYLKTNWSTLKQRLQQSKVRPLVNSAKDWDSVESLLAQRQSYYEHADIIIDTDNLTPLQVAHKIATELTL
jgi:shikimate kinase